MPLLPRCAGAVPRRLFEVTLSAAVAMAGAACATPGASAPIASPSAGASAHPPAASASAGPADSADTTPSDSAGSAPSDGAAPEVWLPDWADESVPEAVATRTPLPFCGVEKPPAPQPMIFVDRIVRLCFREAAELGQEAEWVSIQGTMEGGTVATVYRVLRDGTVEVLTDWSQDPFGAGGWTRMTCRQVVDVEGEELVGVDGCDEAVPIT